MRDGKSEAHSTASAELSVLVLSVLFAAIVAVCTTPWFRSNVHTNEDMMTRSRIATAICLARTDLEGVDFMDCHSQTTNSPLWTGPIVTADKP